MAGRPRTPTKILDLKGSYKTHPERKQERAAEPKPRADRVTPPKYLSKDHKACWREIIKQAPPGVYTNMDRQALEVTCVLLDKFRKGYTLMAEPMSAAELGLLTRMLSQLGMTPADRSRIAVPKQDEKTDGWADA